MRDGWSCMRVLHGELHEGLGELHEEFGGAA